MDMTDAARIFVAAMIPIGELRFSIPYGVIGLNAPWFPVMILSIMGNILPILIILPLLGHGTLLLERNASPLSRVLRLRVQHVQAKQQNRFLRWGAPALVILVAIPLPFTGAWTGALAAWVFHVPMWKAVPLIAMGVIIAGVVVTAVTVGGVQIGEWILEYRL